MRNISSGKFIAQDKPEDDDLREFIALGSKIDLDEEYLAYNETDDKLFWLNTESLFNKDTILEDTFHGSIYDKEFKMNFKSQGEKIVRILSPKSMLKDFIIAGKDTGKLFRDYWFNNNDISERLKFQFSRIRRFLAVEILDACLRFTNNLEQGGDIKYDCNTEHTIVFKNSLGDNLNRVGREFQVLVENVTGATLSAGVVVSLTGKSANFSQAYNAVKAVASVSNVGQIVGMVSSDIENEKLGLVTLHGTVYNINTAFASSSGEIVYINNGGAGQTTVTFQDIPIKIGIVGIVHESVGSIFVISDNPAKLTSRVTIEERDDIANPIKGEFLFNNDSLQLDYYDGTYWRSVGGTFNGRLTVNAPITPPPIEENTNDYAPEGIELANIIRMSSANNYSLTGIAAPFPIEGQLLIIRNVGTRNITLKNNDNKSEEGNRFDMNADKTVQGGESLTLVYDSTALRWFISGISI